MFEDIKQSDTAPVAWRYLVHGEWFVTNIRGTAEFRQSEGCVVEPLYTTLAQSDAERRPDDNFERHQNARISKLERDIDAAVKAGLATRNPAPNAAPSSYNNTKTVTIGGPALAQSDAGLTIKTIKHEDGSIGLDVYNPPRPDASAGLIEAAEHLEMRRNQYGVGDWNTGIKHGLELAINHLRARAADRGGK